MVSASSKGFLDIQAAIECRFSLKRAREMTITCSRFGVFINWPDFIPISVYVVNSEQVKVGCI